MYFSGLCENSFYFYFIICLKLFFGYLCLRLSWQLVVRVAKGVLAHQSAHLLSLSDLEKTNIETSRLLHVQGIGLRLADCPAVSIPHICHESHENSRVNFFWPM